MKKITATKFECDYCTRSFDSEEEALSHEKAHRKEKAFQNMKEFELKQVHLDLLKGTWIGWDDCEFGAPEIDPKRPYGNSDVEDDIAEMIKLPKKGNWDRDEETWNEKATEMMTDLHKETQIALQIILHCQTFELGRYRLLGDGWQRWEKIK